MIDQINNYFSLYKKEANFIIKKGKTKELNQINGKLVIEKNLK